MEHKVCSVKKDTKFNQVFCIIKSWEIISISLPEFYLIIWLMRSPKNFEKIPILKTWQVDFFWGIKTYFGKMMLFQAWKNKYHIQKTTFASKNLCFNDILGLFLTEANFATSEGNQRSYFQNGYFFKILWWSHEPHNKGICR